GGVAVLFVGSALSAADKTLGGVFMLLVMLSLLIVYPIYKAIEWRWWASGVRFGEVRFESGLPAGRLIGLYLKVLAWFILLVICFAIVVTAAISLVVGTTGMANMDSAQVTRAFAQQGPLLAVTVFSYAVLALGLTAIIRIYLVRDIWARVAESARVHNLAAADNVAATGPMVGTPGEAPAASLTDGRWRTLAAAEGATTTSP